MKSFLFILAAIPFSLMTLSLGTGSLEDSCKEASNSSPAIDYAFCMGSLQMDPHSRTADPKELALIAGKITKANYTSTQSKIQDLLHPKSGLGLPRGAVKVALSTCSEVFSDAVDNIDSAIDSIKSGDITGALVKASAVFDAPDDCQTAFDDVGAKRMLVKETDYAKKLSNIFLDFTNFLKKQ